MKTMLSILVLGLAGAAPAAAFEFDPAGCTDYVAGTWKGGGDLTSPAGDMTVGSTSWLIAFAVDGTYVSDTTTNAEGNPAPIEVRSEGGWSAKPGAPAKSCEVALTPKEGMAWSETFTPTGPDEMTNGQGHFATRQK